MVATGGGAVLWSENRTAMRRTGWVCRLKRDLSRLPKEGRPLSQSGSLEEMERVRGPLYGAAMDFEIQNDGSPEETAAIVWKNFMEGFI